MLYLTFLSAVLVTMVMIPPLMKFAGRLKIIDLPDPRKVHMTVIPRVGGIAIVAGALVSIGIWIPQDTVTLAYLLGALLIFVFGVFDDRWGLDYKIKFAGQLLGVLVVVFYGGIRVVCLPCFDDFALPAGVSIPLTIFVLLGVTNAINLADGLDGLAGGSTLLSLGAMALIAYQVDSFIVLALTIAVIGSVLGFLRYNTHPAQIFMGDSGSQFLGFSAGVLVLLLTQADSPVLSPALPLLLLGLPILDTLMVMGQRLLEKRSPFKPDRNHIHHKLLALGLQHYEAVFIIYFLQACLVTLAYYLRHQSDVLVVLIYAGFCCMVGLFFYLADRLRWRFEKKPHDVSRGRVAFDFFMKLNDSRRLAQIAFVFAAFVLPLYLLSGALSIRELPLDMTILGGSVLLLLCLLFITASNDPITWIERAGMYITASIVVYLVMNSGDPWLGRAMFALNIALALAVVAAFTFSREINFTMTPLDYLIVFIVLTVPNLPNLPFDQHMISRLLLQMVVVFYATELVIARVRRHVNLVRSLPIVLLLVMLAKAL